MMFVRSTSHNYFHLAIYFAPIKSHICIYREREEKEKRIKEKPLSLGCWTIVEPCRWPVLPSARSVHPQMSSPYPLPLARGPTPQHRPRAVPRTWAGWAACSRARIGLGQIRPPGPHILKRFSLYLFSFSMFTNSYTHVFWYLMHK
jgi:hypothetical protein